MRIRGLGVIEDAVLELAPGLTVVTGETGAGKTMVVTGLGLLFGGRADAGAVRPGADERLVEGRLRVDPDGAGGGAGGRGAAPSSTTTCCCSPARSRPRAARGLIVGGRAVPVGVLAELAEPAWRCTASADQSRLLQPARQREALDRYAGAGGARPARGATGRRTTSCARCAPSSAS